MAVGININKDNLNDFEKFLENKFSSFDEILFQKILYYDSQLSINQINNDFLNMLDKMEPYGKGNIEPQFLLKDIIIDSFKILKNKHILIFFKNDLGVILKGISFNSNNTIIGEYITKFNQYKFEILCTIKRDNFANDNKPQIHINDIKLIN